VTDPAGWVSATLGSAGSPSDPKVLDFIGQGTARLGAHHTIMGNPSRVQSGVVPITLDNRWRRSMRPGDRRLVTGLTAPLLGRYGYLPHRSRRP
jgi:hypothetical protein